VENAGLTMKGKIQNGERNELMPLTRFFHHYNSELNGKWI